MPDTWYGPVLRSLPGPRLLSVALGSALGAGAICGLLLGIVMPPADTVNTAVSSSPSTTAGTAPATSGPSVTASPTAAASTATPTPIKTVIGTRPAAPGGFIDQPQNDRSLELVRLLDAQHTDRGVRIKVQRVRLLTGDAARNYLAGIGHEPRDIAVQDTNQQVKYLLRDDAVVFGQHSLGQHDDPHQMGLDEFVQTAQDAISHDDHPAVWLRHSLFATGPVVYLAEQNLS